MAEEVLVEVLIEESILLIKELDRTGDNPQNALWFYYSDAEEWRLLLAGSEFDKLLPKDETKAYQRIAEAISKSSVNTLTIADVKPVRTDATILQALRLLIKTPADEVVRAQFHDCTLNGMFIKDALVLRAA